MTNDDLNTFEGEHDNNSLSSCLEIYPHIDIFWKSDKRNNNRPDDSRNLASILLQELNTKFFIGKLISLQFMCRSEEGGVRVSLL